MKRLSRREFLSLSAATAAGVALAACQPIQPPTPAAEEAASLAVPPLEEVNLLDAETQAKVEKLVQFVKDNSRVPGLLVGILQNGRPVYAQGFGVSKIGTEQPVTPQSIFQLMDTTHLFTATAAMQLVEQGKLDLDAPVVEYIPYFKLGDDRYTQITMRHLLSEAAGLPATPESAPQVDWKGKTPQTDDGALERYVRSLSDTQLVAAPGTPRGAFMCNMGYDIAGDVIAKVSGQVYEEYMEQYILQPLGMNSSTFYFEQVDPALRVTPHVTKSFSAEVSELATWSREHSPSVGLCANLEDMLRWAQANLNRGELDGVRILQASSYDDELWKPQYQLGWSTDQAEEDMGGCVLGTNGEHRVCNYWANNVGFHNAIYLAPEDNAGMVVLGNQWTAAGSTYAYAYNLSSTVLPLVALK